MDDFEARVLSTLRADCQIPEGVPLVVGASGGADSTALLLALSALGHSVTVAHLHHGLRGAEADGDEAFVRGLAARLDAPFVSERVDVAGIARSSGRPIEEVGRNERYAFLQRVAEKRGHFAIATGHTMDDQAETVLARAGRGCGVRGLRAILPIRHANPGGAWIVRPLLDVRRADVEAWLRARGQAWREDSSNRDRRFQRNRLRAALAEVAPDAAPILARIARLARKTAVEVRLAMEEFVGDSDTTSVSRAGLLRLHTWVRYEVYREFAMRLQVRLPDRRTTAESEEAIARDGGGRDLRGGWRVEVRGDRVEFRRAGLPPTPIATRYWPAALPGETELRDLKRRLSTDVVSGGLTDLRALLERRRGEEEWVDADRVVPPLVVRRRRKGDRFHPLGAQGEQRLKKFFIDHKVPREDRDLVPLLCDQEGILWVAGQRIRHSARVTEGTARLLHLRVDPLL